VDLHLAGIRARLQVNPRYPSLLPGFRPDRPRSERGGGLTKVSALGGWEEFCQLRPSPASSWVVRSTSR